MHVEKSKQMVEKIKVVQDQCCSQIIRRFDVDCLTIENIGMRDILRCPNYDARMMVEWFHSDT